jgi:hypothetical protein
MTCSARPLCVPPLQSLKGTVGHIILAAGDGLQRMRVDQIHLEAALFQNLKQWNPVHPGGLHRYRPEATTLQPLGQGVKIAGEAAQPARCLLITGGWNGYVNLLGSNIDSRCIGLQNR